MLSRLASRAVSATVNKPSILYRVVSTSSNNNNAIQSASDDVRRFPHDAPERDFKNFPPVRFPKQAGKVRIGLIPDEWFKAMYDKTGVMGPYIIFWGAAATILSKEIYVAWADSLSHMVAFGMLIAFTKLYGKKIGAALDKVADEKNKAYNDEINARTKSVDDEIQTLKAFDSLPEANSILSAAKKEIVQLQLESAYRQRLAQVYQEVKKRLDYQVAVQNAYKRVEREQAINYIIGEVNKSIGPNQEKEAFQSGLSTLKSLSQKYAGTI